MKTVQKALILLLVLAAISIAHAAIAEEPKTEKKPEEKTEQVPKAKEAETPQNKTGKVNELEDEEYKMSPQQKKIAACITLFYYQKKKDKVEWLKLKEQDKNDTLGRRQKLEAVILGQCNKALPDTAVDTVRK